MTFTRNMLLAVSCVFLQVISVHSIENIMLRKSSKLSTTHWNAAFANDGKKNPGSLPARTRDGVNPFWKGDLQGHFTVHSISVTSDVTYNYGQYLGSAYVEVHASGNSGCLDDIVICGQCPKVVGKGQTFTFSCSHPRPVRFVKVWRNLTGILAVSEVVVKGTPATTNAIKYNKEPNTKIPTPVTLLNITSAADCSSKCYANKSCRSFSYHPTAAPNCLLATNADDAVTAGGWTKYTIDECSSYRGCD